MRTYTLAEARGLAISAQGLHAPRPARATTAHFASVLDRVGLVQLDSVNVLARAHHLTYFSRLGPYDMAALDAWLWPSRDVFEYWGHAASLLPVGQRHLYAHRMTGGWHWASIERFGVENAEHVERVLAEVRAKGPLTASELAGGSGRTGPWWGYGKNKLALEYLFVRGLVVVARRKNFARYYDLPERVHPAGVLDRGTTPARDAQKELLLLAAGSCGVASEADLADYHRIRPVAARPLVAELVREGSLERVAVEGWSDPAYVLPKTEPPPKRARRARATRGALVGPFDSLLWCRARVERLFGVRYRIEIYVPEQDRVYGYYVLAFVLDDEIVARVDLKADRSRSALMVRAAHAEGGGDPARTSAALARELHDVAAWLGLGAISVGRRGTLARELRKAVGA